jgi:hypothetical protein
MQVHLDLVLITLKYMTEESEMHYSVLNFFIVIVRFFVKTGPENYYNM